MNVPIKSLSLSTIAALALIGCGKVEPPPPPPPVPPATKMTRPASGRFV